MHTSLLVENKITFLRTLSGILIRNAVTRTSLMMKGSAVRNNFPGHPTEYGEVRREESRWNTARGSACNARLHGCGLITPGDKRLNSSRLIKVVA